MKGKIQVEKLLSEIRKERGSLPKDLHITRMCGALVAASNGKIIKITETRMKYCPLFSSLYDQMHEQCPELREHRIARAVESKISRFGHFTDRRELVRKDVAIPFGASEMIMYALERKGIDAAVTVCDGAGTVITHGPSLVQGIGARMNGLFYTSPIDEVTRAVEKNDGYVLSPKTAAIDQILGLKRAVELGYRNIAVTINGFAGEHLSKVKEIEEETNSCITILVVCTTGVEKERTDEIAKYADLVWSCASLNVREIVGKEATIQIGVKIPVFVLTKRGIGFISNYSSKEFENFIEEGKRYVIMGHPGSNLVSRKRIKMDNFQTYLCEINELPLRVDDEPRPLI
jgi:putative methanogenesis marker protein 8